MYKFYSDDWGKDLVKQGQPTCWYKFIAIEFKKVVGKIQYITNKHRLIFRDIDYKDLVKGYYKPTRKIIDEILNNEKKLKRK